MNSTAARYALRIALVAFVAACARKPRPVAPVLLLTTPEVAATGIVQHLGEVFAAQTGKRIDVRITAAETIAGQAKGGGAEVVVTNDANVVAALHDAQLVRLSSVFASDDYVIAGPRHDPAHVRRADDAPAAFHRIFSRRRAFCSPVSVAPLHERELAIWSAAKVRPEKDRHYAPCTGDAATVLAEAARRGAYTLTDRATADVVRPAGLAVLLRGVPMLSNDFTIVLVQRPNGRRDAEWFVEWVMSFRGRDAVESYRVNDQKRLYVEP